MFSEHKKKQEEAKKNGELIFDDLNAKTSNLKLAEKAKREQSGSENAAKGAHKTMNLSEYMSEVDGKHHPKRKSIKKSEQKASTMSLNVAKSSGDKEAVSSQRSNSLESPAAANANANVGLSIFEAATMMCNIVDITTDSTTKTFKSDKSKQLKSKESKTSLGSTSGPFAQMKEAQEQKRKSKASFELDDDSDH